MLATPSSNSNAASEQILEKILAISLLIQQSLELDEILNVAVRETHAGIQSDRVIITRLLPNQTAVVTAESVGSAWIPMLGKSFQATCSGTASCKAPRQQEIWAFEDISANHIETCDRESLTQFQVRAQLVVPIFFQGSLWGYLITHHCQNTHSWCPVEVQFLQQVAVQLGIAIQQIAMHQQLCQLKQQLEAKVEEQTIQPSWMHDQSAPLGHAENLAEICDRTPVETALRQYERIVFATPDCVALLDCNYIYQVINQTYLIRNNKTYEDIVGHSVSDLLGEAIFQAEIKPCLDRCLTGNTELMEAWIDYPDGKRRFVRATYAPYVEVDGAISGIVINVHDLTNLKGAEEALFQSEERFRQMAASIHEVFWMADIDCTQILYVSPAYEKIWGRSCTSLYEQPKSFLESIHPDDQEQVRTTIEQQRQSGFNHEYRLIKPDGTLCWIWEQAFPVQNSTGQPYRLVGISQNITERKAAEAALRESQQQYKTLVENSPDIIERFDTNLRHLYISSSLTQITGIPAEVFLGKTCRDLGMSEAMINTWELAAQALLATGRKQTIQFETPTLDGVRSFEMLIAPELTHAGAIESILCISRDVTERARLEAEHKAAEQKLRQQQQFTEQIAESTLAILYIYDLVENRNVYVNQQIEVLLGYSPAEIQAMGSALFATLVHPEDLPAQMDNYQRCFSAQDSDILESEYRMQHKNGEYRWLLSRDKVFNRTVEGLPRQILGVAADITLLKQTQLALRQQAEREHLISAIAQRIRQSLELDEILNTTVGEVRQFLQCDRVIIYRFEPDWSGFVLTESVAPEWRPILNRHITDTYFVENHDRTYPQGTIRAIDDVYAAGLSPCHLELMEQLQVKAKLIVPIYQGEHLWGLLVAFHCASPRSWQSWEGELLSELSIQVGIAIQQSELYQRTHRELVERKRTEAALRISQARFAGILDIAKDAIISIDIHQRITLFNQGAEQIFGYSAEEILGQPIDWLMPERFVQAHQQHVRSLNQNSDQARRMGERGAIFARRKDGSEFPAEASISKLDLSGEIIFTVILRDITERKAAEMALQESYEILQKLSEQVPGFIYQYRQYPDGQACFPYASQGIRTIYEVTPEQVKDAAEAVFMVLHPDDLEFIAESIEQSACSLQLWHAQYRVVLPQRGVRWLEGQSMPERLPDGGTLWHGYIQDITERKATELALQISEEQRRLALDLTQLGSWDWNIITGELVWSNQTFFLLGYELADPSYTDWRDRIHPEDMATVEATIAQSQKDQTYFSCEYRMQHPDGKYRWILVRGQTLCNKLGESVRMVGIVMDISDRKRAEDALHELNRKLEQRVEERTEALIEQAEQERLLRLITQRVHSSLNLEEILTTTLVETRQTIWANRVAIYRFNPDWSGQFVAESVGEGWVPLVAPNIQTVWEDSYLQETQGGRFKDNETFAVCDIYTIGHTQCHVDILEQFQVRAYAIAPIFVRDTLWGLLAAYQNTEPRDWQRREVELLRQIATQVAIAIQQSNLFQQVQTELAVNSLLVSIAQTINQSVSLDAVLEPCLAEIRQFLQCDRVLVCRFDGADNVVIEQESVSQSDFSLKGEILTDPCFKDLWAEQYRQGRIAAYTDIQTANLAPCHVEFLTQLQVQSNLVVGILHGDQLWGLLIAHHCFAPHQLSTTEIDLFKRAALQLGIAGQKASLYTQLELQLTHKEVLLKEVHHRVKNNLQVISSLLNLQSSSIQDPNILQPFVESQHRINVMAMIHERLYRSGNLASLNFADYIQDLVEDLFQSYLPIGAAIQWQVEVDSAELGLDTAIPCGLIINELVSNALKYAFPNKRPGEIHIAFSSQKSKYTLTIRDNGIGFPQEIDFRNTYSLGMQVVCALTQQLDGNIELNCENGTTFIITF